jgi:hypothetical protein
MSDRSHGELSPLGAENLHDQKNQCSHNLLAATESATHHLVAMPDRTPNSEGDLRGMSPGNIYDPYNNFGIDSVLVYRRPVDERIRLG